MQHIGIYVSTYVVLCYQNKTFVNIDIIALKVVSLSKKIFLQIYSRFATDNLHIDTYAPVTTH